MKNGYRPFAWVLLVGYAAYILYVTVFGRAEAEDVKYNFMPFWSYLATMRGEGVNLMQVNFLNVVMFVPMGLLLWCAMGRENGGRCFCCWCRSRQVLRCCNWFSNEGSVNLTMCFTML